MKQLDLIVVDVGNSACKVGEVQAEQLLQVHSFSLEECAHQPWRHRQVHDLIYAKARWVLSGSNPPIINSFAAWLTKEKQSFRVIDSSTPLPIEIDVQYPDKVGRDRLLNAVAVEQKPAIVISAGTAVTVDAVDADGRFLGGAIFPGLHLMATALHEYTAKLPLIQARPPHPMLPGKNTEQAMHGGIVHAVVGGIIGCVTEMLPKLSRPISPDESSQSVTIYVTGGDGPSLQPLLHWLVVSAPQLTLQGIIIASRTLWP